MSVKIKVAAKFAKDDVRTIKFTATKKQVTVRCKGMPKLAVAPLGKKFTCCVYLGTSPVDSVNAKTPAKAYKAAVRKFWL